MENFHSKTFSLTNFSNEYTNSLMRLTKPGMMINLQYPSIVWMNVGRLNYNSIFSIFLTIKVYNVIVSIHSV